MTRALARVAVIVALGACKFDVGAFDERACTGEGECRPDENCIEGLCAQIADCEANDPGPVILSCGAGYQFSCDPEGGCLARECTDEGQCAQGYTCTGGFCALDCEGLDADSDAVCDDIDNCPSVSNVEQTNSDTDSLGDACDACDFDPDNDVDSDQVCGDIDNCPNDSNTSQLDTDGDLAGNECDTDDDNDGQLDVGDLDPVNPDACGDMDTDTCDDCAVGTDGFGPLPDSDVANDGSDTDSDGRCDPGDADDDNDGRLDGVDACPAGDTGWVSNGTTDFDSDGCRDDGEDMDDDNDGVGDAADPSPKNADLCGDSDGDSCNDCAVGTDNTGPLPDVMPANDGTDTDGDGACNAGDLDDDGDGVNDGADDDPLDPFDCRDMDGDSCDDCAITGGPPSTANDGLDTDTDGLCNTGDADDDGDGVNDGGDNAPLNPFSCRDLDTDTCDDCSITGGPPAVANDGADTDADGDCNLGDTDDDNDGVADGTDPADANPMLCGRDIDADTCDDCAIGTDGFGPAADFVPANDGLDTDADGECNLGDPDDDGDTVNDASDTAPLDPLVCRDLDADTCDDCAVTGGPPAVANDGTDTDGDGACNLGDTDDDNDGRGDAQDPNDTNPNICGVDADTDTCDDCAIGVDGFGPLPDAVAANDGADVDGDGICAAGDCDDTKGNCTFDCTDVDGDGFCAPLDCDDCISACTTDCTSNTDGDGAVNCVETFCGSNPAAAASVCRVVTTEAALSSTITMTNMSAGPDFILLDASFTVAGQLPTFTDPQGVTIRQCEGTTVTLNNTTTDRVLFDFDGNNNLVDDVDLIGGTNANILIRLDGGTSSIIDSTITGYEKNAIFVTGASNLIMDNRLSGGTQAQATGVGAIAITTNIADNTTIVGNVITDNAHDGINIEDADNAFIDHNTIANNAGDAVDFTGGGSSTLGHCMRNNIVSHNSGAALRLTSGAVGFNTTGGGACLGPLTGSPDYGNDEFMNTGGACAGAGCASCSCVPGGANGANFWEFTVDPQYTTMTPSSPQAYCLASASALIDAMDNLGYDVNGDDGGLFNPTAPDGGGREAGSDSCPAP